MTFLLTFFDMSSSLECHKAFKRAGLHCDIDNVPPQFGLSCDYCIKCETPDVTIINKVLQENNITHSKIIPIN
jgi:hypothetical protein